MYSTNASTRKARVKYEYAATEDNQLSINKGDSIELIGEVTSEGWILARNSNGDEGYIPDKYFEVVGGSSRPPQPPPMPSNAGSGGISTTSTPPTTSGKTRMASNSGGSNNKFGVSSSSSSRLMEQGDEYGLFAYQYEWFAVISLYIGGILSFLYSTTLSDEDRVLFIILGILSTLVTSALLGMISQFRNSCDICGCGTVGIRMGLFIANGALLGISPIGQSVVAIALVAAIIEFQLIRKDIRELPQSITDEWAHEICGNGGLSNCSLGKLIVFFTILAINIVSLGYGFSDGYNYAIEETDKLSTNYYLNPGWTGMMYGFGRVITISMSLMLLFGLFGCCSRQERNIKAKRKESTFCGKFIMLYADQENRRFFHRCIGYSIVWGTFLHCLCAYYCYEDSSSTHSFYDIYGYWILVSGGISLLLLSIIIGSANDTVCDQGPKLFLFTHRILGALLALFLIFHGSYTQIVGQYYWIFILGPFLLYSCDALYRYARSDM